MKSLIGALVFMAVGLDDTAAANSRAAATRSRPASRSTRRRRSTLRPLNLTCTPAHVHFG